MNDSLAVQRLSAPHQLRSLQNKPDLFYLHKNSRILCKFPVKLQITKLLTQIKRQTQIDQIKQQVTDSQQKQRLLSQILEIEVNLPNDN